ncbi:MAG TPA: LPS export ABC transporter permease LptG [Thermoanaerobaculia bacterium]|nr:LPS export ABC transporter permease LptG [Thermoanaerobaculia bacterium]
MKILTRYILKEMIGPTALGFGFYTFIILMRQLFDFAGMIIKRSLPASTVFELLWLSLPHIIVLTLPMSLLFGILIAVGRLSADSEIISMRALGISTRTIYRPVFIFSFMMFLLNFYLMNVVLPAGNTRLMALRAEIYTSSIEKELRPRIFYDEYANVMIYVNDVEPRTGRWKGVFVADSRTDESQQQAITPAQAIQAAAAAQREADNSLLGSQRSSQKIIVAENGNLSILPSKQVWLNLYRAENHLWDPRKPDRYDLTINNFQRMRLPDRTGSDTNAAYVRSFREMNLRELMQQARVTRTAIERTRQKTGTPDLRENYALASVEIHKKFAIPLACVVFGVLGLPLGITNRRGGKSSGFSLSVVIILVYYIMLNNGEQLATTGKLQPWVAMWTPNIILLVIGIYLLGRANRETSARSGAGIVQTMITGVAALFARKRAARADLGTAEMDEPEVLRRLDITFPNILDRYILREFLKILTLVLVSVAVLAIVVDYTQISGDVQSNRIPFHTVFAYYRFYLFQILNWTLPISVLVATLITFGLFSKNNEVTAFKSAGMSLYRVAAPIVGIAVAMSVLSYLMLDYVLPYSNQRVDELRKKIKGQRTVTAAQNQQKLWFLGKGRYIINFLSYDRNSKQLSQIQIFEFHPTQFRLTRRVYAESAKWDGQGWVFERGWMRSFGDDRTVVYTPISAPLRLFYSERPEDFATEIKQPDQMTFAQLRRYVDTIRKSGYAAEDLSVKLYEKTSWPFISVVMALIALPFAFRTGKRGALYGIGIALVVGIIYWMVFAIFTKFGEVGNLPAILSAWSANVLFAIAAIYLFLHVET